VKRAVGSLAALALAACSSGNAVVPANFKSPRAVAVFQGMNPEGTGTVVPLLAVAATRGNELRIIDPSDDRPVAAPNAAYSLSVPTVEGPTFLGVASMSDGGADVLVVASGGTVIQLFGTWLSPTLPSTDGYGIVWTQDLSQWNLGPSGGSGNQILSVAGGALPSGPAAGSPPVAPATPGRARIFIGLAGGDDGLGGKLLVLDFERAADGSVTLLTDPTAPGSTLVLGFSPEGLSFAPDNVHLYVASRDPVRASAGGEFLGIAEIDTSAGTPSTWQIRAFPGLAPTTAVASAYVGERTAGDPKVFQAPVMRVYAAVDAAGCGREKDIACGIATYDPAKGTLAADPSPGPSPLGPPVPAQAYETPLFLPAIPFAFSTALPPATGSQRCTVPIDCDGFNAGGAPQALMALAPTTGLRWTTVVGAVASGDGSVYVLDLGRWSSPDDTYLLSDASTRTQVYAAATALPSGITTGNYIGLVSPPGLGPEAPAGSTVVTRTQDLPAAFIVWPGYTPDDTFTMRWQGILPGLGLRRGVLGRLASGETYLAVQQAVNPSGPPPSSAAGWIVGAFVGNPEMAVHASSDWPRGDFALYIPDAYPAEVCPGHEPPADPTAAVPAYETTITAILPPRPAEFPGGALQLDVPPGSDIECLSRQVPLGTSVTVTLTVRASGLLLTAGDLGYVGRPEFGRRFNLAWRPEEPPSGDAVHDEEMMLARKARRFYYPGGPYAGPTNGGPCPGGSACYAGFPEMTDPMQSGPVIGFRPAQYCGSGAECPAGSTPPRDATLAFTTLSGVAPMARRATSVAVGTAVTTFDKSTYPSLEYLGRVFYTTFVGDALMMLPPGQAYNQTTIIR
jgi:hypothetical protein